MPVTYIPQQIIVILFVLVEQQSKGGAKKAGRDQDLKNPIAFRSYFYNDH